MPVSYKKHIALKGVTSLDDVLNATREFERVSDLDSSPTAFKQVNSVDLAEIDVLKKQISRLNEIIENQNKELLEIKHYYQQVYHFDLLGSETLNGQYHGGDQNRGYRNDQNRDYQNDQNEDYQNSQIRGNQNSDDFRGVRQDKLVYNRFGQPSVDNRNWPDSRNGFVKNCGRTVSNSVDWRQGGIECYFCGKKGHIRSECYAYQRSKNGDMERGDEQNMTSSQTEMKALHQQRSVRNVPVQCNVIASSNCSEARQNDKMVGTRGITREMQ